jgi:hypothetical protein
MPRLEDVVVSKCPANTTYEVGVLGAAGVVYCNRDSAVAEADQLAKGNHVDAWLTEDHVHFLRIKSYRANEPQSR